LLLAATTGWAFATWYFARVMLQLQYTDSTRIGRDSIARPDETAKKIDDALVTWAPRVLGALPFLTMGLALVLCSAGSNDDARSVARWLSLAVLVVGAAFFVFVTLRRAVFGVRHATAEARTAAGLRKLPPRTRFILSVYALVHVVLIGIFSAAPVTAGQLLGGANVLVTALATWIGIGTGATYLGLRWHVPVVPALASIVLLSSRCNDNHVAKPGLVETSRPTVEKDYADWRAMHSGGPVFVVATEGGGVRAAYWTALVLAHLHDHVPHFEDHLYAVSSVSGGSVGAAVFLALSAGAEGGVGTRLQQRASDALSVDAVAPVLGKLLYPELFQQFIPIPVGWFDRSTALENAWVAPLVAPEARIIEAPITEVWSQHPTRPRLFLNSTWVETGKRAVFSWPVATSACQDCVDAESLGDFALVRAAHDSARFPYISPPSTILRGGAPWGHVVDGGYFENSGAATAQDVAAVLKAAGADVRGILIRFGEGLAAASPPDLWAVEEWAPVDTLLNTRQARGALAVQTLYRSLGRSCVLEFGLAPPSDFALPLGWTLSDASKQWMDHQFLQKEGQEMGPFEAAVKTVSEWVKGGPSAPCGP
jgi:hypothetical protein